MTSDPYMKKDFAFEGWKKISSNPTAKIHYFREGISLCRTNRLFADSLNLDGGKTCTHCLRLRADEKRRKEAA